MKEIDYDNSTIRIIALKEWIFIKLDEDALSCLKEKDEESMFKEFVYECNPGLYPNIELENTKELNANKQEVIKILKEYKNKIITDFLNDEYKELVNDIIYFIKDFNWDDTEYYCPSSEIMDKAKKEAIKKLYNKYYK